MIDGVLLGRRAAIAGFAIVLVGAAGCGRRETGPETVEEALARRDYDSALLFCEDYFSELARPDPRPEQTRIMREEYRKAFVRWSLARRGRVTRSAEKRIAAFLRYTGSAEEGVPK